MVRAFKFLRSGGNRKPAVPSGGSPEPAGSVSSEKDETIMAALSQLNKNHPKTEGSQLDAWMKDAATRVFSVTALVTPTMAEALLKRNGGNRPVIWTGVNRSVAAYAAAMARGEWVLNGEPVIISSDGSLNDGQHRLHAIVQSGVPVQLMLTFGVERDTRHTVDQGVARTPGHILAMFGEKDGNNLATALQFMWANDSGSSLNNRPSPDQLLATLAVHPELRSAVTAVGHMASHYRLSRGYIAAAYYLTHQHDPFTAEQFLKGVQTGLNIKNVGSPVMKLRRQFEEHSAKRRRIDKIKQAALYIKAFNMFLKGRSNVSLSWRQNGDAESFPVVGA